MLDAGGNGEAEGGTGGGAEALGVVGVHAAFEEGGSGGSEGFGGPDNRAGVAGVLNAVQDHYQRFAANQLVQGPTGRAVSPAR